LSSKAQIAIAGQEPGLRLRKWMGITRDIFYNPEYFAIVPMGFCFPGYDAKGSDPAPPRRECVACWWQRGSVCSHAPDKAGPRHSIMHSAGISQEITAKH